MIVLTYLLVIFLTFSTVNRIRCNNAIVLARIESETCCNYLLKAVLHIFYLIFRATRSSFILSKRKQTER
jgi:hypothetical protein